MTVKDTVNSQPHSGIVKWYSYKKGYGFITSPECKNDILVHFSALDAANIRNLRPGDKLTVEITETASGIQAKRVIAFEDATYSPHNSQSFQIIGKLKWFNRVKGFGFVLPEQGGEEIFVHATIFQRANLMGLQPGEAVEVSVIRGPKGLEATNIKEPDSGFSSPR
jgi:CspA family cold shock protein